MGLFSGITIDKIDFGGIFSSVGTLLKDLRTAITGTAPLDPTKLAELEAKALEIEQAMMNAQSEINKIEAGSTSLFVAGWRPGCGWLCVSGLAWYVFIWPLWTWISTLAKIPPPPIIDTSLLVTLLVGMLGLGTLRTYEKKEGLQGNH
jgi:hypothetical protein